MPYTELSIHSTQIFCFIAVQPFDSWQLFDIEMMFILLCASVKMLTLHFISAFYQTLPNIHIVQGWFCSLHRHCGVLHMIFSKFLKLWWHSWWLTVCFLALLHALQCVREYELHNGFTEQNFVLILLESKHLFSCKVALNIIIQVCFPFSDPACSVCLFTGKALTVWPRVWICSPLHTPTYPSRVTARVSKPGNWWERKV